MVENAAGPRPDDAALTRLFATVGRDLRRRLQRILGNVADVEEVAQEACLKVWDRRDTIRAGNPGGFLYRTATNLAIERRRQQGRRGVVVPLDTSEFAVPEAPLQDTLTPERHVSSRAELDAVRAAFLQLSERHQRAFALSLEGHTQAAIAQAMGTSQSVVWKLLDQTSKALVAARRDFATGSRDFLGSATVITTRRSR